MSGFALFEYFAMFDSITIGTNGSPHPNVDAGFLAECLLFYRTVRVVTGAGALKTLVRTCGANELLELCEMGRLEIEFLDNLTGIVTLNTTVGECHDLGLIGSNAIRFPQLARQIADEEAGSSGKRANELYARLNRVVVRSEYDEEIIKESKEDLFNRGYLEESIRKVLSYLVPEYPFPDALLFRPQVIPKFGIHYETNLDFSEINSIYHRRVSPQDASVTPAYLLAQITGATPDIMIASRNTSEFAVDPIKSAIVASRFSELIKKASAGKEDLESFKEVIIDDSRSIREAVNRGDRSFREVISLIENAERFKEWLQNHGSGEDLRAEYCKSISHAGWAEALPAKSIRFLIMSGAGVLLGLATGPVAGAIGGVALNAADYFLIDRLIKGWKPNQFTEGPLKEFLNTGTTSP